MNEKECYFVRFTHYKQGNGTNKSVDFHPLGVSERMNPRRSGTEEPKKSVVSSEPNPNG